MSLNVYAKCRCAALRIKKDLGIFRELITTTRRTTREAGPNKYEIINEIYWAM